MVCFLVASQRIMSRKGHQSTTTASDAPPPAYDEIFGPPTTSSSASLSRHGSSPSHNNGHRSASQPNSSSSQHSSSRPSAPVTSQTYGQSDGHHREDEEETRTWFAAVDEDGDGFITAEECRQALLNDNYTPFNVDTIKMMLKMFDRNFDDVIDYREFKKLKKYVVEWKQVFNHYDADRSGTIETQEIHQAFRGLGYDLNAEVCDTLCKRFSPRDAPGKSRMNFDAFIYACAMINALQREQQRQPQGLSLEKRVKQWISQT